MPEGTITLDGDVYTVGGLEVAGTGEDHDIRFLAYVNRSEFTLWHLYNVTLQYVYVNVTAARS
jgi:hypothetical protein